MYEHFVLLLICDAGIGVNKFALSSDGIDRHFAVNVLGHFLLTNRLLPLIRHTARLPGSQPPRIISVSSSLHQATPSDIKFQSLEELNNPDLRTDVYYDRSKLALILHTKYGLVQRVIAPHQDSIYALATHPGAVHTDQQDQFKEAYGPVFGTMLKGLVVPFMRNPEQGSLSTLWAATSPEVIQKDYQGVYVQNPGYIGGETKQAQDPELGENLWKLNNQLILEKLGKDGLLPWDQVKQ
ncbi:hypothetical protein FRC03_001312 [Tulasnella sp. 419]|nr:hypothetical protein FRC03_001312 [Tulasnella sp. 419]